MTDTRTKNSTRNIIFGMLDKTSAIVFPFAVRTIFIKVLGEECLGLGSLYNSILQVINLADLGFSRAVCAALYKPIAENRLDQIGELLNIFDKLYKILGGIILTAGIVVMPFLGYFTNGSQPENINIYILWLIYLAQAVISYVAFAYKTTLISAVQRSDVSSRVAVVCRTLIGIVQILLVLQLEDMYVYAILNAMYTLIYNCICAYICRKKYPQYKRIKTDRYGYGKRIMKDAGALALQKIGNTLSVSLDSIVISSFLGLSVVAIYGNYYYVISAIAIFISLFIASITASIGNSIATEEVEKNYQDFMKIFFLHSWIVGWCSICFIVLFQDFMFIWVGEGLLFCIAIVLALVVRFYFEQIRRVVLIYKDAAGLWRPDKWRPIVGCAVNIVLNIVLVRYFGVIGVALSTVVDFAVIELPWETHILFDRYFRKSPRIYYCLMLKSGSCILANGAITYFVCGMISFQGILALSVKAVICLVLPNIMYLIEMSKCPEFGKATALLKQAVLSMIIKTS